MSEGKDRVSVGRRLARGWDLFVCWCLRELGLVRLRAICELDEDAGLLFEVQPGLRLWRVRLGGREHFIERRTGKYDRWGRGE